jgi:hypothetical protein
MELHDACVSMPIKRMPTRVINVSGSHTARLMNTQNLEEPWVALSYCWGPSISMTMTATVASIPSLMQGFNIADLPRTIHDAVVVTRLLGIDYLCKLFCTRLWFVRTQFKLMVADFQKGSMLCVSSKMTL